MLPHREPGSKRSGSSSFANRFHCHQHWNRPGDWAPTQALNLKAKESPNHGRDADDDVGDVPEVELLQLIIGKQMAAGRSFPQGFGQMSS